MWCCTEGQVKTYPLQWRHNGCDGVSYHQSHGCLLNRLFRHKSTKTSKLRVTGFVRDSPHAENVSIWWRHHVIFVSIAFVYGLAPSDARSSTNKLLSNFEWGLKLHISLQWHQNHMNNVHIFISAYVYDIFTDKILLDMTVSCWYLSNEQSPFIGNTPIKAAWNIKLLHPLTRATLRSHLSMRRAMKESCHGNSFRITGPLWGEYIDINELGVNFYFVTVPGTARSHTFSISYAISKFVDPLRICIIYRGSMNINNTGVCMFPCRL